ncbi:MAG: xanthine dehydrogenase accessory protein XdhC [Paracoccaceae bacterium]
MSFDLAALRAAVARHGRVARVVVAQVAGSTPRDVGAAMLVWAGGQSGTIGGGALEYQAAQNALQAEGLTRYPLGPALGQCCGGAVTLLCEHYDAARLAGLTGDVIARGPGAMPPPVRRMLALAAQGVRPAPRLHSGWMVEPVSQPTRAVWIWGAGHVGRALVHTLGPLPDIDITWVDFDAARFAPDIPADVDALVAANPADAVRHAPDHGEHVIVTHSHQLDLDLCHRILGRRFGALGLIGSDTKRARFRSRLAALGHSPARIARLECPIGDKALGKHPQAIAIGVAAALLSRHMGELSARGLAS